MGYKLKENVNFELINKKSLNKFNFDLAPYYNRETRIIETPKSYIEFSRMGEIFIDFLIPLNLVEKVEV